MTGFTILLNSCGLITTHSHRLQHHRPCARPALPALLFGRTRRCRRNEVALPCFAAEMIQKGGGTYSRWQNMPLVSPVKCHCFGAGNPISSTVPPAFEQLHDFTMFSGKPSGFWRGSENCVAARTFFTISPSSAPLNGSCSTGKAQGMWRLEPRRR